MFCLAALLDLHILLSYSSSFEWTTAIVVSRMAILPIENCPGGMFITTINQLL